MCLWASVLKSKNTFIRIREIIKYLISRYPYNVILSFCTSEIIYKKKKKLILHVRELQFQFLNSGIIYTIVQHVAKQFSPTL